MHSLSRGSDTAIVVLHEIYGFTRHIRDTCEWYHAAGYDVYCPDLLGRVFSHDRQAEAYQYFMTNVGFDAASDIASLLSGLSPRYARIIVAGYSVGATLAWIVSGIGPCNGVVCHYGSRIRKYLEVKPLCPVLLIAADQDDAFPVAIYRDTFDPATVAIRILPGKHGFCDPYGWSHDGGSAEKARQLALDFINSLDTGPPTR